MSAAAVGELTFFIVLSLTIFWTPSVSTANTSPGCFDSSGQPTILPTKPPPPLVDCTQSLSLASVPSDIFGLPGMSVEIISLTALAAGEEDFFLVSLTGGGFNTVAAYVPSSDFFQTRILTGLPVTVCSPCSTA